MSEDVATLKDTVVTGPQESTVAEPVQQAATEEKPVRITEDVSPDAAVIGELILKSGYTKDQINDLLQAPQALNALRYQLENDPREFIRTVERTNPQVGERFLESLADEFVTRYETKDKPKAGKTEATVDNSELESLRQELRAMQAERQGERNAAQLASTRQRYDQRLEDLFNHEAVKSLGLTKAETKNMRARVDVEMGRDSQAASRASAGNFVDVPRVFQGVLDELVSDRKAKVEAEKTQRERQQKGAFQEFQSGPNPFSVDIPGLQKAGTFDNWDNTEKGFAEALERAGQ